MILFPPCKINLGLRVLFKRPDGYHALDTLIYQLPFTDTLEILRSEEFSFASSGLPIPGDRSSNLCIRAYELMRHEYNISPVKVHLHKVIPMGGGLGGGSSDASYTLLALNELFGLNLTTVQLQELAAELGSDCPSFILPDPQIASGRGERLGVASLSLKGYFLKLVNLGIHVSTKEAFAGVDLGMGKTPVSEILALPVESWKDRLINDFERSVFEIHPRLGRLKEDLYAEGAVYAAMSGSGSTLFAIYREKPERMFPGNPEVFEKILEL